jgi:hypothetical protein
MANELDWTDERCCELAELQQLVSVAGSMNRGSNVVEKIKLLEELAAKLQMSDLRNGRGSFMSFLNDLAIADREAKRAND